MKVQGEKYEKEGKEKGENYIIKMFVGENMNFKGGDNRNAQYIPLSVLYPHF